MNHTYLRYECADSFGLAVATASSKAPVSNRTVGTLTWWAQQPPTSPQQQEGIPSSSSTITIFVTTAGPYLLAWNVQTSLLPVMKWGHVDQTTGGIGTGKALNADEMTCLTVGQQQLQSQSQQQQQQQRNDTVQIVAKIATGSVDGTVRVWDVTVNDMKRIMSKTTPSASLARSILLSNDNHDNDDDNHYATTSSSSSVDDRGGQPPLVLMHGHGTSPIKTLALDASNTRLASASTDGSVVLWDLVSETGLYRLTSSGGHKGAITDLCFVSLPFSSSFSFSSATATAATATLSSSFDGLITASADGLIKVWDLQQQCSIQTIAQKHKGEVLAAACCNLFCHRTSSNSNSNSTNKKDKNHQQVPSSSSQQQQQQRWRLLTGGNDGVVRVWKVEAPRRNSFLSLEQQQQPPTTATTTTTDVPMPSVTRTSEQPNEDDNDDDVCTLMGILLPPLHVVTSNEKVATVHFNAGGTMVGVLHAHSKLLYIYSVLSYEQANKKRLRRIKRRQEKFKLQQQREREQQQSIKDSSGGPQQQQQRGFMDDPTFSSDSEEEGGGGDNKMLFGAGVRAELKALDPSLLKASDEFQFLTTVRATHKIRDFVFLSCTSHNKKTQSKSYSNRGQELARVVCTLTTNAAETHVIQREKHSDQGSSKNVVVAEKLLLLDMYGHPTGIRAIALSSDDALAVTVSKNITKVWNVTNRSVIQSIQPTLLLEDDEEEAQNNDNSKKKKKKSNKSTGGESTSLACYGLCAAFLPGNTHVILGTREGHVLIIDLAAGEVVYSEKGAHDGAVWSLDVKRANPTIVDSTITIVTGSADKSIKFWDVESSPEEGHGGVVVGRATWTSGKSIPVLVHTRTLQMTDDVVAVKYSHAADPTKRMVFVSSLDCTVKVFFDDSLKLFLNLYGHKLPALTVDASDDDLLLASAGADKTIKIWGTDFGDTHRTLHGHDDSITDLRFVRRTHNFFTSSKDGTVRYWDGDRFEQILVLNGHFAEVNCLAVSKTGAFVLSGGMDRQVRVWERTKDMVFLEEERERELEKVFDKVSNREEGGTANILDRRGGRDLDLDGAERNDDNDDDVPQTEEAVKRSIMSINSGDRIMEALERADEELNEISNFRKTHGKTEDKAPNPMLLGLEPAHYILWILKSVKTAELEQSLLVLPLGHVERLVYYLIVLLRSGRGIELCARIGIYLVKTHQNQLVANKNLAVPLRELRRWVHLRLREVRDMIGFDMAAMKMIARVATNRKNSYVLSLDQQQQNQAKDVWAGLGLGSDVAAALEGRNKKRR